MGKTMLGLAVLVNLVAAIEPHAMLYGFLGLAAVIGTIGLCLISLVVAAVLRDSREDARVQREYEEGLSYERANRAERIGGGR